MCSVTLQSTGDIRAVFAARISAHGQHLSVYGRKRAPAGAGRFTVAAGRRVGNAVTRNRAKRRLRALVREFGVPDGTDLVLVAKPSAATAPYRDLLEEFRRLHGRLHRRLELAA